MAESINRPDPEVIHDSDLLRKSAFAVAIGSKVDIPIALQMSASDPKRTNEGRPRSARPQRTLSGYQSAQLIESACYRDQYRLD